jgi:hypothetical protein
LIISTNRRAIRPPALHFLEFGQVPRVPYWSGYGRTLPRYFPRMIKSLKYEEIKL